MRKAISLFLEEGEILALKALAFQHGLIYGNGGSLKKFLEAIATGDLWVQAPLSSLEQDRLVQLVKLAVEGGQGEVAETIALWLSRQPQLTEATLIALQSLLPLAAKTLISALQGFIEKKQPFSLSYSDSSGKDWLYTVVYAHFQAIERHRYLVAKVTEKAENPEHPDLAFNRCFRLDRILAVLPATETGTEWQTLATTPVTFRLYGNWTKKYDRKLEDRDVTWLVPPGSDSEAVLQVVREVWSFFWLLRELQKYHKIQIVAPEVLKNQHIELLKDNLNCYGNFQNETESSLF